MVVRRHPQPLSEVVLFWRVGFQAQPRAILGTEMIDAPRAFTQAEAYWGAHTRPGGSWCRGSRCQVLQRLEDGDRS